MAIITVRFKHLQSSTPITELQTCPTATVGELRALLQERLASEERCLMRVFGRWHAELAFGGRKAAVELTEADEGESLASLGIGDYSEVQLDGPLTGDVEGVGQAVALLGHQVQRQGSQTNSILLRMAEGMSILVTGMSRLGDIADSLSEMAAGQRRTEAFNLLPNQAFVAYHALCMEEHFVYCQLQLLQKSLDDHHQLRKEVELEYAKILGQFAKRVTSKYFIIDQTTPHPNVSFEDPYTAVKTANGAITLRASKPLTAQYHKWAVKIVGEFDSVKGGIVLGLLPKLTPEQVANMGSSYLKDLGGWGVSAKGTYGDWQCEKFAFSQGDVVCFDFSFANKTLTINCGDRKVVGYIPSIKEREELYPAFYLHFEDNKLSFVELP